jgi:UDP-N-acetylglucosamine--N-acetylmuramyl-(pentapeptide) pyrophosphoryl-undecaprenol N-acetylglucosamine transferase
MKAIPREEAAATLGVNAGDFVIGVVGGSLSSASLASLAGQIGASGKASLVIVLGPPPDAAPVSFDPMVRFVGRRWDMTPFYSLCDAVVCRAGASTLAELAALGIPALVVPWKKAADGHQEANARCFAALTGNSVWDEDDRPALNAALSRLLKRSRVRAAVDKEDSPNEALWRQGTRFSAQ